jgi:WD40 repeat protein
LRTLPAHDGPVHCLAYAPNGAHLASGGQDGIVRIWHLASGRVVRELAGLRHESVGALAFTPDGKRLVFGHRATPREIVAWDWHNRIIVGSSLEEDARGICALAHAPDRPIVLAATLDGGLLAWDVPAEGRGLRPAPRPLSAVRQAILSLAISPDGRTVAAATGERNLLLFDAHIRMQRAIYRGNGSLMTVTWSPDGKYLATGERSGVVGIWKADPFEEMAHREGHDGMVLA